ncbi:MAG TPA: hypothetical protein VMB84_12555, partial [Stellaceae bacterium]|nr:hypothetical protein [Stellaceae bacterium]
MKAAAFVEPWPRLRRSRLVRLDRAGEDWRPRGRNRELAAALRRAFVGTAPPQRFDLILPAWGSRVGAALDLCLASLLAPGNLPALGGRARLVIA